MAGIIEFRNIRALIAELQQVREYDHVLPCHCMRRIFPQIVELSAKGMDEFLTAVHQRGLRRALLRIYPMF